MNCRVGSPCGPRLVLACQKDQFISAQLLSFQTVIFPLPIDHGSRFPGCLMQQIFPEPLVRCLVGAWYWGREPQEKEQAWLSTVLRPSSQCQGKTEWPREDSLQLEGSWSFFFLNIHTEKAHFVMGFHQVDTHYSAQGIT